MKGRIIRPTIKATALKVDVNNVLLTRNDWCERKGIGSMDKNKKDEVKIRVVRKRYIRVKVS